MTPLRISFVCLTVAAAAGGASFFPSDFLSALPQTWSGILRGLCILALLGFAVSFMVGLARALQEGRGPQMPTGDAPRS